jgi:hypothetical protein
MKSRIRQIPAGALALVVALLVFLFAPDMVERYGFYESKGSKYRADPRGIVEFFDFLKPKPRELR